MRNTSLLSNMPADMFKSRRRHVRWFKISCNDPLHKLWYEIRWKPEAGRDLSCGLGTLLENQSLNEQEAQNELTSHAEPAPQELPNHDQGQSQGESQSHSEPQSRAELENQDHLHPAEQQTLETEENAARFDNSSAWDHIPEADEGHNYNQVYPRQDFFAPVGSTSSFRLFRGDWCAITQEDKQKRKQAWSSIVALVAGLNGLKNLIFDCNDYIPPELVSVLCLTRVCLHHHKFFLGSLLMRKDEPQAMHDDDKCLATSPCLHQIVAWCDMEPEEGFVDYTEDAIRAMAAGTAPNLQHVTIQKYCSQIGFCTHRPADPDRRPWTGFSGCRSGEEEPHSHRKSDEQEKQGIIRSFSLIVQDGLDTTYLQSWRPPTLFSSLHTLDLDRCSADTVDYLVELARNNFLLCLRHLTLDIWKHQSWPDSVKLEESVATLLSLLPNLVGFHFTGSISAGILAKISSCLHKLRDLTYYQKSHYWGTDFAWHRPPRADEISPLRQLTDLRSLNLTVHRTGGSDSEILVYQTLAILPALRELSLRLELQTGPEDHHDDSLHRGRTTRAMKNSAMDASLAGAIFAILHGSDRHEDRRHRIFHANIAFVKDCLWEKEAGFNYQFGVLFRSLLYRAAKPWVHFYVAGLSRITGGYSDSSLACDHYIAEAGRAQMDYDEEQAEMWKPRKAEEFGQVRAIWEAAFPPGEMVDVGEETGHWSSKWKSKPLHDASFDPKEEDEALDKCVGDLAVWKMKERPILELGWWGEDPW